MKVVATVTLTDVRDHVRTAVCDLCSCIIISYLSYLSSLSYLTEHAETSRYSEMTGKKNNNSDSPLDMMERLLN